MASRGVSGGLWANCQSGPDSKLQTTNIYVVFVRLKYCMGHAGTESYFLFTCNANLTGHPIFLFAKPNNVGPH